MAVSYVGIFWGIPDEKQTWNVLSDKTPIDQAVPYGRCLTHAAGHYEFWESLSTLGQSFLAESGLPVELAFHEYEDFPRGRVVYWPEEQRFAIYADRKLQNKEFITRIAAEFHIGDNTYTVRSDSHYQTI